MASINKMDIKPKNEDDESKLLPCPFCGSNSVFYATYQHAAGKRWCVLCFNCLAQIDPGWAQSRGAVQALWNARDGKKEKGNNE